MNIETKQEIAYRLYLIRERERAQSHSFEAILPFPFSGSANKYALKLESRAHCEDLQTTPAACYGTQKWITLRIVQHAFFFANSPVHVRVPISPLQLCYVRSPLCFCALTISMRVRVYFSTLIVQRIQANKMCAFAYIQICMLEPLGKAYSPSILFCHMIIMMKSNLQRILIKTP